MKKSKIIILNQIISAYPQFKKISLLQDEIMRAIDCKLSEAETYSKTHCNMVSFWACLKSAGVYDNSYSAFFKFCIDNKLCNVKGFISNKPELLKKLKIKSSLETYREYEDILNPSARLNPDKFYQIKIKADTDGDHFMACYVQDGVLYLSDTSYRGVGVKATDFITEKNFQKISEVA